MLDVGQARSGILFAHRGSDEQTHDSRLPTRLQPNVSLQFPDMFAFLVTLLVLDALLLSVVVLLQAGQGGGLASLGGGGTDTVLGGRQAVTILTKLSWWCGGIFLVLSLVLSLVPRGGSSSALQERLRATTPAAPAQQTPLPLGTQPSADAPKAGDAPSGTPQPKQAPLPLGAPTKPAPKAGTPSQGAPAPQQPKQ
jgi:preprotein translocase subunit SecG